MRNAHLQRKMIQAHTNHGVVNRAYWVSPDAKVPNPPHGSHPTKPSDRVSVGYTLFHKDTNQKIAHALEAIGSVHSVPNTIYKLPIKLVGVVDHTEESFGQYITGGKKLLHPKSAIHLEKGADGAGFHLLHEYGHYLDHHLFGTGEYSMRSMGTFRGGKELLPLMRAISKSESFKAVLKQHERNTAQNHTARLNVTTYLLRPPELFARAYSQYIATRSGSKELRAQFVKDETAWREYGYMAHWNTPAFKPIAREFDRLFKNRGLLSGDHR